MSKKALWILFPIVSVVGILWYFFSKKQATAKAAATPTQTTTNSASDASGSSQGSSWFSGWTNFASATQANATALTTGTYSLLGTVSNLFGTAEVSANPGVSVSGSNNGGTATSSGGVGLPSALSSTVSNIFKLNPFSQSSYKTAPLNNYDVQKAASNAGTTSQQSVDNGLNYSGGDFESDSWDN